MTTSSLPSLLRSTASTAGESKPVVLGNVTGAANVPSPLPLSNETPICSLLTVRTRSSLPSPLKSPAARSWLLPPPTEYSALALPRQRQYQQPGSPRRRPRARAPSARLVCAEPSLVRSYALQRQLV